MAAGHAPAAAAATASRREASVAGDALDLCEFPLLPCDSTDNIIQGGGQTLSGNHNGVQMIIRRTDVPAPTSVVGPAVSTFLR